MNRFLAVSTLTVVALFVDIDVALAKSPFKNLDEIRRSVGITELSARIRRGGQVTVAVLDKGFKGYEAEVGKTLPENTSYSPGPVEAPEDLDSNHGLRMAQILTGLVTDDMKRPSRLDLKLYNVYGYSNLKAAIDDLVANPVDLVLYSEVWEYGGNFDGEGFINAQVRRATDAGLLWINAAGNFAKTTYNSPIETQDDGWVQLPDENNAIKLVCNPPAKRQCPTKVVLSWDDFKDDSEAGTNKDLDLTVSDDLLNILQASSLRQSADRTETRPGYSKYPREIVSLQLDKGTYFIRVKDFSKNFRTKDRLRITADGEFLTMPSTDSAESLLNPADNADVLTVGASDSDRSSVSVSLEKPELTTVSSIKLNDDNEFRGSSNSAAITAAAASLWKLAGHDLSKEDFLKSATKSFDWTTGPRPVAWMMFWPTGNNCFNEGAWNEAPDFYQPTIAAGGKWVSTTQGWRIMVPFDPIELDPSLRRSRDDDMIALTSNGYQVYSRYGQVPQGAVEVFQRPQDVGLCQTPTPAKGRKLAL